MDGTSRRDLGVGDKWYERPFQSSKVSEDYFRKPSPARLWNYRMGGDDNLQVDRDLADAMAAVSADVFEVARQARQYLTRAVHWVAAEGGVWQFLDLGCGLPAPPSMRNVHEVAQNIYPDARVVYVDNDKVVLAHATGLMTSLTVEGSCSYIGADARDTEFILAKARETLDFTRPVAVVMFGILGAVEFDEALGIVSRVMGAVPPGSYLLQEDGIDLGEQRAHESNEIRHSSGVDNYSFRTPEQFRHYFDGLEVVEPGIVPVTMWRPDPIQVGSAHMIRTFGGVARKP